MGELNGRSGDADVTGSAIVRGERYRGHPTSEGRAMNGGEVKVVVERTADRAIWQLQDAAGRVACEVAAALRDLSAKDVRDLTQTFEQIAARRRIRLVR